MQIVGCTPQINNKPEEVNIIGFLDKENEDEKERLYQLYKEAAFFILPTKAECVGMSFIEAASFGLPAIGTEVGGVPEAVTDNKTGLICKPSQSSKEVAEWILSEWSDKQKYKKLSRSAFDKYRKHMNWQLWGERVKEVIEES